MSDQTIDSAVAAARQAFEEWSSAPPESRAAVLQAFAEQLKSRKPDLLETISRETGKPRWESATEVDAMISKVALSIRAHAERRSDSITQSQEITTATR